MECLECDFTFPLYPAKCTRMVLAGGIKGFVLALCGTAFNDYQDLDEWCSKINAQEIVISSLRRVTATEPEAEEAVARLGSCDSDELLGMKHTLDVFDYNSEDPTSGFSQDTFYNWLNKNYAKLSLGFILCDDRFYGLITSFSVVAKKVIEPDNFGGKTYWHIVFKWQEKDHAQPILIPGSGDAITNCTPAFAFRTFAQTPGTLTSGEVSGVAMPSTDFTLNMNWLYKSLGVAIGHRTIAIMGGKFALSAFRKSAPTNDQYLLRVGHLGGDIEGILIKYDPLVDDIDNTIDGAAHYLGLRKTGNLYELFLDGFLRASATIAGADFPATSGTLQIGSVPNVVVPINVANEADFRVDEIYFYNSALNDTQMADAVSGNYAAGWQMGYNFNIVPVDPVPSVGGGVEPSMDIINPPTPLSAAFV